MIKEKEKRKQYRRMLKMHKKAIMKAASAASKSPFDSLLGLDMFVEYLKFMKDYYAIGYNIMAEEFPGRLTRLEGITKALEEYNLGYDEDDCTFKKYFNAEVGGDETFGKPLNGVSYKEADEKYGKSLVEHKNKFYKILSDEMDFWWD